MNKLGDRSTGTSQTKIQEGKSILEKKDCVRALGQCWSYNTCIEIPGKEKGKQVIWNNNGWNFPKLMTDTRK